MKKKFSQGAFSELKKIMGSKAYNKFIREELTVNLSQEEIDQIMKSKTISEQVRTIEHILLSREG